MNSRKSLSAIFPWKIFTRLVLVQAGMILMLFLLGGFVARSYLKSTFSNIFPKTELAHSLKVFDQVLIAFMVTLVTVLTLFAMLLAKKLFFPIGRVLIRTKSVLNRESSSSKFTIHGLVENWNRKASSEWNDLETLIEDIRKDLNTKIESLKREREEQATLMSAISDAILAVDREGSPLFYNSRFALVFGNAQLEAKKRIWEMTQNSEILEAFEIALKSGKSSTVKATPFNRANGTRFFSIAISPLQSEKNAIYGAVGIFHDVTDLKRAEQIRIDFVANVSHELRTPLTAIKGYVDTLHQDCKEGRPVTSEFLDVILRNSDRLMNLINDLLDLSSLESSDILHKSLLSTEDITTRVVSQLQGTFEHKKQSLQLDIQTDSVLADPRHLEQVLVNLLDNASKYTPLEGSISLSWERGQKNEILLKIKDSGPGIPTEHHSRLFERFYRVDKARSREQGGTGLGLAIVKHIMQRHDGSVYVESTSGEGSTFICQFPAL